MTLPLFSRSDQSYFLIRQLAFVFVDGADNSGDSDSPLPISPRLAILDIMR